jgi:hypothetical protein
VVAVVGDIQQEKRLGEATEEIERDERPGTRVEGVDGDPAAEEDGGAGGNLDPHQGLALGETYSRRRIGRGGGAGLWERSDTATGSEEARLHARQASEGTRSSTISGFSRQYRLGLFGTSPVPPQSCHIDRVMVGPKGQLADGSETRQLCCSYQRYVSMVARGTSGESSEFGPCRV